MKKTIVLITGLMLSCFVSADAVWFSSKISHVYPRADGSVVFKFEDDSPNCTNGNTPKYYYLAENSNGVTDKGFERIYSALLTAAAANKTVSINFDSANTACYINRAIVKVNN